MIMFFYLKYFLTHSKIKNVKKGKQNPNEWTKPIIYDFFP